MKKNNIKKWVCKIEKGLRRKQKEENAEKKWFLKKRKEMLFQKPC